MIQKKDLYKSSINLIYKAFKLEIMKRLIEKIVVISLLSLPMISNAQFAVIPGGDGRTNPAIKSIGVGTFTVVNRPQANLHVNQLLMPNSPFFTPGHIFRTDGDSTLNNMWQLFTGASATAQTERFRLFVPANDSTVTLQSTTSSLILADNKTQISVQELKTMQQQIALLQQQLATLQKELELLKAKN